MSRKSETFMDICLNGKALLDEIDNFVDDWHDGDSGEDLHDHLGMSWEEYSCWAKNPDLLPHIVAARREGKPLKTILSKIGGTRVASRGAAIS